MNAKANMAEPTAKELRVVREAFTMIEFPDDWVGSREIQVGLEIVRSMNTISSRAVARRLAQLFDVDPNRVGL